MALALHERGVFAWKEWADTLAQAIGDAYKAGDPDSGENYYRHWLTALERIVTAKGVVTSGVLAHRRLEWDQAARRTPHGQPIELNSL
jgi:nitrile hydratase accessory protein